MDWILEAIVGIVAFLHLYFMYFEMFTWETRGPKLMGRKSPNFYKDTKVMAANQGLYNGLLAAGLIWSFFISTEEWQWNIRVFFLLSVAVAGIYGALTAHRRILYIQAIPAILGLLLLFFTQA